MFMSKSEFAAMMGKNPSLKIAKASPTQTQRAEPYIDNANKKQERDEMNSSQNIKYRNLKVYVFEDGFIYKQAGNKSPIFPEHGRYIEKYDSVKEYDRMLELRHLEKQGCIRNLQRQVKFELQPGFKYDGKYIRPITYTADFCYEDSFGHKIIEDVKGLDKRTNAVITTKEFDLKWKMMQYKHPDHILRIEAR